MKRSRRRRQRHPEIRSIGPNCRRSGGSTPLTRRATMSSRVEQGVARGRSLSWARRRRCRPPPIAARQSREALTTTTCFCHSSRTWSCRDSSGSRIDIPMLTTWFTLPSEMTSVRADCRGADRHWMDSSRAIDDIACFARFCRTITSMRERGDPEGTAGGVIDYAAAPREASTSCYTQVAEARR